MKQPWFLGIDLGTGSCKSIVVDENACILGFGAGDYPGKNVQDKWQEQNPDALIESVIRSVHVALERAQVSPESCAGLSLGGALHSLVLVDKNQHPLTGVMTWADGRAMTQAEAIKKTSLAATLYQETGCPIHGMYPVYKIIRLRQERPEIFKAACWFLSAKEYVLMQLTGDLVVDPCLASGSGLFNIHTMRWNEPSLECAGITEKQLSPIDLPGDAFLSLKEEVAERLGIPAKTRMVLGSSDAVNSSLGAGAVFPGRATCMIGTSGAYRVIHSAPIVDRLARNWCYAIDERNWLVGGAINNGGLALEWLLDFIHQAVPDIPEEKKMSLVELISLAQEAGTGARGLVCLPFFAGERSPNWNLKARALFFGLSLEHRAGHLAQSLLEGIAFRMRSLQELLAEIGLDVQEVRASGGFTRSDWWIQVVTDVLDQKLRIPEWGETSALGTAFWAMRAEGLWDGFESLAHFVPIGKEYLPSPEASATYHRIYPLYLALYAALEGAFDHLAEVQRTINR